MTAMPLASGGAFRGPVGGDAGVCLVAAAPSGRACAAGPRHLGRQACPPSVVRRLSRGGLGAHPPSVEGIAALRLCTEGPRADFAAMTWLRPRGGCGIKANEVSSFAWHAHAYEAMHARCLHTRQCVCAVYAQPLAQASARRAAAHRSEEIPRCAAAGLQKGTLRIAAWYIIRYVSWVLSDPWIALLLVYPHRGKHLS